MFWWPVTIPSVSDSSRFSTGYRSWRVRNAGAIFNKLSVTLSIEWQRAQLARAKLSPRSTFAASAVVTPHKKHSVRKAKTLISHLLQSERSSVLDISVLFPEHHEPPCFPAAHLPTLS